MSLSSSVGLTALLAKARQGDEAASSEVFALVNEELRKTAKRFMAGERVGHTLQPSALVDEAWLKLVGPDGRLNVPEIAHRGAFLAIAARAMRQILVDYANAINTAKRGGGQINVNIEEEDRAAKPEQADFIAVNDALKQLETVRPRAAHVAELLFITGCTIEETAEALGVSATTVQNDWRFAKAWLRRELSDDG